MVNTLSYAERSEWSCCLVSGCVSAKETSWVLDDYHFSFIFHLFFFFFFSSEKATYLFEKYFWKPGDNHVAPMVKMFYIKLVITIDQWDMYRICYNGACVKDLSRFPL